MSKQLYTVSKEGLDYLCGLINKIASLPSELISDITLSTNQTMSSVKIDKIIKQCLQDANEYSNEVVNSLTHLIAEKIDFEPTLDNTTDKINTLLLYSANSDNNYTQYLRLTNELLNLGDTSLSLNEYMKEVDADAKYTLKTTTDTLTTEVNNIKSDLNTHTEDTDIHTSADEKASYVKKTSITTTINSTSTDSQVPSASIVADEIYGKYVDVEVYSDALTMPIGKWRITSNGKASQMQNLPVSKAGILEVKYLAGNDGTTAYTGARKYAMLTYTDINGNIYKRSFNSDETVGNIVKDTGWQKLATETQVDELFQSVSDGKTLVANAITDKGVSTSTTATFATMATNIGKITNYTASEKEALATAITNKGVSTSSTASFSTMATNIGKISVSSYKEETKSYNNTSSGITPITLTFSANVLGIKQVIPPTYSSRINTQTSSEIFTINGKELTLLVTGAGTWEVTALIKA